MNDAPKDGGPAFPEAFYPTPHSDAPDYRNGMTLRDYFAGQALAGMLANGFKPNEAMDDDPQWEGQSDYQTPFAVAAYRMADAMLAERAK